MTTVVCCRAPFAPGAQDAWSFAEREMVKGESSIIPEAKSMISEQSIERIRWHAGFSEHNEPESAFEED